MANAYTPSLQPARHRIADHGTVGNRQDFRHGQGLPALRQMQAGVLDPRAARQPALHPRNKILATSLLVEAFLYEEQTRRGISLKHFDEFNDVADHCTVCHRCLKPCPVDIDFGDVSVAMRNFLRKQDKKRFSPGTATAMAFLTLKDPATIKLMRAVMMEFGFKAQRLAHKAAKALGLIQDSRAHPPATVGAPTIKTQVIHFLNRPMPGNLPKRTSRALLDIEDDKVIPVIRNPHKTHRGFGCRLLFPRLRLRAPVLAGRSGDAGDALRNRRHHRAAAGLPVLRLPADLPPVRKTRARRSPPTTACFSTASPTRSTTSTSRR